MTFQVQVSIPYFNGLPRDCATNVLHFDTGITPAESDFSTLTSLIELFYESCYSDTNTCAAYADNGNTSFKWFDLSDTPPRSPVYETVRVLSLNSGSSVVLPPEAAVVLSLYGSAVSGLVQGRRRGRVYLGVLGDGVVTAGTASSFPTVSEAFRTDVAAAAAALEAAAITAGWLWVIYSRASADTSAVVGGFVDDAIDIQRRRGQDPTIRNTWGVTG